MVRIDAERIFSQGDTIDLLIALNKETISLHAKELVPDGGVIFDSEEVDFSDEELALIKLWETTFFHANLLVAPPGVPEDRLSFLVDLANQWVQDEGFRAEINTIAGEEVQTYMIGEEVTQAMLELEATSDEFQAIFTELIEKYRA